MGFRTTALLPVNQHTQKLGFFICLTTATGCDWHRLEVMDIAFLDVMGIGKVKPGQYETACGKGYWDCRKDEPKILSTKRDAVEFFKDESASSVYVYNARETRIHLSGYERLSQCSDLPRPRHPAVVVVKLSQLTALQPRMATTWQTCCASLGVRFSSGGNFYG